jgi:hypothetical protein
MTVDEAVAEICGRLNLTSQDAKTRVAATFNRYYHTVTSTLGIDAARFTSVTATTTNGVATVEFTGLEKIDRVIDATDSTAIRLLTEVTIHQVRSMQPGTGEPVCFAIQSTDYNAVTIRMDTLPQTTYSLVADGWSTLGELTGNDSPAIPASFHDILIQYVLAEEYERKEKTDLADRCFAKAEHRLSELRFHLADTGIDFRQGSSSVTTGTTGTSGGSGNQGGTSYTQTGLVTFSRGTSAPFACVSGAAVVTYLDADKLDGQHGSYYTDAANLTGALGALSGANLTALNATQLTSGTVPLARLSGILNAQIDAAAAIAWTKLSTTGSSLADLTTRSATDLTSGTLPDARFPATLPAASGVNLTALNATNLASGTVAEARLGSGTGSVNKVLRGNSTWGDAPGITTDGSSAIQQIAFAATQSASANANTLDDYEEGTFTPTWAGSGSNPAIGDGTLSGRYVKVGQLVFFSIAATMGASTTYGTGDYSFTLPFTAGSTDPVFTASLKDSGTAYFVGTAFLSSTTVLTITSNNSASLVGAGAPFTFASGDWIKVSGCYRASA